MATSSPKTILYPHQIALVDAMTAHHQRMTTGFVWRNQIVSGKLGILADPPGTGKTLSVLTYIARLAGAAALPTNELVDHSNRYFYSHVTSGAATAAATSPIRQNLVIVPHIVYDQWTAETEKRTKLKPFRADTRRALRAPDAAKAMASADFVLTTSACYKYIAEFAQAAGIAWNHIFIDDASSIYLSANEPPLEFQFLWLITSTWTPFLFKNRLSSASSLLYIKDRIPALNPDLDNWLTCAQDNWLACAQDNSLQFQSSIAASAFFKNYLPYNHNARGLLVLRTADDFIRDSAAIPPMAVERIKCLSYLHGSLPGLIQAHITKTNIPTLLTALSVPHRTVDELIRDIPYKASMIREKAADDCAICLDAPVNRIMLSCCGGAFCGRCILRHMTTANSCPTCRHHISVADLTWIDASGAIAVERPLASRMDYCVSLAKEAGNSLIIYTTYDNIYYQLADKLAHAGILAEKLDSNPYSVTKVTRAFDAGTLRVVCVSNIEHLRGLNFTAATHIIFYHALPFYELRQILLNSAHRLGRQHPLKVVQLESEFDL